jgi:hypothetical protein
LVKTRTDQLLVQQNRAVDPLEQHDLLGDVTMILVGVAPPDWQRLVFRFDVVDRKVQVAFAARTTSGDTIQIPVPREVSHPLSTLRKGMRASGAGVWSSIELLIDPPSKYQVKFSY